MGKALGTIIDVVLIVAAVAVNVIPGIGQVLSAAMITAITTAGIGAGLSLALSAFTKNPVVPAAATSRLTASIDTRAPRVAVFGRTAAATDIRDEEYTGTNQEYFHRFMVCAAHTLTEFDEIWFEDKQAWTLAGGVQGDYVGYLTVDTITTGSAANAINISSRMGSTRRYTGCAYVHFRFKLTGNSSKATSPFSQSVPTRVTIIAKGMPVYDPRFDSTVAGGSGTMRAADQTTWAYTYSGTECGRNPACQLLTWLLGWHIQNPVTMAWKLSVGKGIQPARIDLPSFITGANLCDESVTLALGGTEPRYRADGVVDEKENPLDVVNIFKATMNALVDDADGQIRLLVLHNDLSDPSILTFNEVDVLGQFSWSPQSDLNQDFNVVRGSFTDPSTTSLYQLIDYPEQRIASLDGIDRLDQLDLSFVQSVATAQRLAKQWLERSQYPGTFAASFQCTAWRLVKGDVIKLNFYPLGFVNKLFRVMETTGKIDGTVPLLLREENAAIYQWDSTDAPAVVAATPTVYNFLNSPVLLAIEDAAQAVVIEWSPDGSTSWGPFTAGDRWIHISTDGGATFGAAILAIGEPANGTQLIFKRAATLPTTPTGDNLPTGWFDGPPAADGNPLWMSSALQEGDGTTIGTWATPVRVDGANGSNGVNGLNIATVYLYQRAASAPSVPSVTTTYTFATGGLASINNGWSQSIPAVNGNPLYVTIATASNSGATDTIATGEWASPVVMASDGGAGLNSASVFLYKRATSAPAVPSVTTTYTFSTGVLASINNGWSQTVPTTDGHPLYVTTATALGTGSTDTILSSEWATPTVMAEDGSNGVSPISVTQNPATASIQLYSNFAVKSGQLPFVIGNVAYQAGASITITAIAVTSASGCTADVVSGSTTSIEITAVSADHGSVTYTVTAGGQTVTINYAFTTVADGASGATGTTIVTNTPQVTWTGYTEHGQQIAINASSTGKIQVNLTGNIKATSGGFFQFMSKIRYSGDGGGSWTDVSGSESTSTTSEFFSEPPKQTGAQVNGTGPYTITGLTAGAPFLIDFQDKKLTGSDSSSATCNLTLFAGQVA